MFLGEFTPFLEATALGLGVGLERDWTNRGAEQQAAGARTFAVLGLAGAAAAAAGAGVVAGGAVAIGLLLTVGYLRTARVDRGLTTEAAALATYLLGALAREHASLAVGAAVVMASVLAAKGPIHRFAREIVSPVEVQDALRFLVVAFVVLPLVPDRHVGPYGVLNPFKIWLLVVTLTGIGWVGYIAVRGLGARRGLPITGFAGGFVSATATTASLARTAKADPSVARPALAGALLASAATLVQLSLVLAVANRSLLARLVPAIALGVTVIGIEAGALYWRGRARRGGSDTSPETASVLGRNRPFSLTPALVLAAVLTAVTLIARWASGQAGSNGAIVTSALAGFADAHAPILAVATLAAGGTVSVHTALLAAGCALASNTAAKCGLAFVVGGGRFGVRFAAALTLPAVAVLAALAIALTR